MKIDVKRKRRIRDNSVLFPWIVKYALLRVVIFYKDGGDESNVEMNKPHNHFAHGSKNS